MMFPSSRRHYCNCHHSVRALQDSDYDEFVQEVVDENAWHHDEDSPYHEDDDPPPQQEDSNNEYNERARREKEEEEKLKQKAQAEQRRDRQAAEEAFRRELQRLPEEQQKQLRQKRRKDGKVVQKILNASARKDYYAVLGLRWFFPEGIRVIQGRRRGKGGREKETTSKKTQKFNFKDALLRLQWPDVTVLRISSRQISQANRKRAMQVHPDKNRDPRTKQAFVAVQDAYEVLSDPVLRSEYEQGRREHRLAVRRAWKDRYYKLVNTTLKPM